MYASQMILKNKLYKDGIEIPNDAKHKPLNLYMKKVFTMPSFVESLTELEKDMREIG